MEKDTNRAILVVSITNPNRLNAVDTEDFFLVDINDYSRASKVLREKEESDNVEDIIDSTSGAIQVLVANGISFERVIEGRRFFFDNSVAPESSCNCDD